MDVRPKARSQLSEGTYSYPVWYFMLPFVLEDSGNHFFFLLKHEFEEMLAGKSGFVMSSYETQY